MSPEHYLRFIRQARKNLVDGNKSNADSIDWQAYIELYTDLKEHGITTAEQAKEHYLHFGRSENRKIFNKGEVSLQLIQKTRRYINENEASVRSKIINRIIKKRGYSSYLEIGVFRKELNFEHIRIDKKIGVDPGYEGYAEATHSMNSDEFFKQNQEKFDIIFIDGMHESRQVLKDINSALSCLNEGGTIICHDMNPILEALQRVPRQADIWNGDCWKVFVTLRMTRKDLQMCVVDVDWGLGIIRKGSQELVEKEELTFENLEKNRKEWLNLISLDEFEQDLENMAKDDT